jgi:signal transduction histidine kinase
MAASICHEIRNPMTTVRGFMQILGQKREYAKDEDIFKLMIEEIDRANEIITNFLSLAGNKEIVSKPVSLNLLINKLYPIINSDALMSDQSLILQLDEVPFLLLDEKEICQLIMNLTRNGIEAMSPGGVLTISTRLCQGEVWLEVADQGKGIAPELIDKLGTPFLTTKDNGTGLGLAVCYSIAMRHNAKIEVDTGSQGTTFRVKFNLKNNSASVWSADDLPIQRCINCKL